MSVEATASVCVVIYMLYSTAGFDVHIHMEIHVYVTHKNYEGRRERQPTRHSLHALPLTQFTPLFLRMLYIVIYTY